MRSTIQPQVVISVEGFDVLVKATIEIITCNQCWAKTAVQRMPLRSEPIIPPGWAYISQGMRDLCPECKEVRREVGERKANRGGELAPSVE